MSADTTRYRWSRALVLRPVGVVVAALGVVWVVGVAVVELTATGPEGAFVASLAVTGLILVAAVVAIARPPVVLDLSSERYRLRHLRGSGTPTAAWRDVESVVTRPSSAGAMVVFELAGGRQSVLPLALLGARAPEAEREIHDRLNTAHGYRALDG